MNVETADGGLAARAPTEAAFEPWRRLRALTDVVQEQQKEAEHLDRKVRFALIVMGLLNGAVAFGLPGWPGGGMGALLAVLAIVDAYFFVHVVQALTPMGAPGGGRDTPGLRSSVDIARAGLDDYQRAWQEVGLDRLLVELAAQAHAIGTANASKASIIRRLFLSLHLMTALAAACLGGRALR